MSNTDIRIQQFMQRKEHQYPELRKNPAKLYRSLVEDNDDLIDDVHARPYQTRATQKQLVNTPYYRALLGV